MKAGIIIAGDGKTVNDVPEQKFSSETMHLPVDFESDPKHYQVVTMNGGSAFSMDGITFAGVQQETLLSIEHNYDYTPFCFAYFYVVSYAGSETHPSAGAYGDMFYPYSGTAGTLQDFITFRVTDKKFEIVHYLEDFGYGVAYTSTAPNYLLRIKYYIAPIDMKVTAYQGDRMTNTL